MIYLDHAATTPLDGEVLKEMTPYLTGVFGNPASQHAYGRTAANALQAARDKIAALVGVSPERLYFTSGGTEAANTAVKGIARRAAIKAGSNSGVHIVISAMEHACLTESVKDLQSEGFSATLVNPDINGIVSPESVLKAITPQTVFVGVMAANNEVGTIQPIEKIYSICKERGIFFFCDCVQTAGVIPFSRFPADGISFSAHKFYGPKGVGCLYINAPFTRLISGGSQERGLRGGTSYVAGAVGCAAALERAYASMNENFAKVTALRESFIDRVLSEIEGTHLNGDRANRLPSNANIAFDGCDGEQILFALDLNCIAVSTGSACSSGAVKASHVLLSMGLKESVARSSVRFTFGKNNTEEEVVKTVSVLKKAVLAIRG